MQARIVGPNFKDWIDVEESICDLLSHLADKLKTLAPVIRMELTVKEQRDRKVWVHISGAQGKELPCSLAFKEMVIPDGLSNNEFSHLVFNKLGQALYKEWRKEDYFYFVPRK